jgi:hypothetical protein
MVQIKYSCTDALLQQDFGLGLRLVNDCRPAGLDHHGRLQHKSCQTCLANPPIWRRPFTQVLEISTGHVSTIADRQGPALDPVEPLSAPRMDGSIEALLQGAPETGERNA